MTAEIAILNRAAVTLAADSAVTIGRGSSAKIYNTVNKIFELHETEPVGIMIYGSLNFMGLPIETLVKLYRKQRRQTKFDTIVGYRDDFINWLETGVVVEEQHEWQNAYLICSDVLSMVNRKTQAEVHRQMMKTGKYLKSKDNGIAQKIISSELAHLKQCDKSDNCKNGYAKDLESFYGDAIRLCIDNSNLDFNPNKQTKAALMRLCIEKLARKSLTSFRTGFVIAGFGTKEICPSLESFEADGIVRGKLKFVSHYCVDIGRKGPHAEIYGFAQDDMILSFLNGIDPSLEKYIESSMSEAVDKLSSAFYQAIHPAGGAIPGAAKAVLDQIKNDALKKFREYKDREFTKRVKDLIGVMPKQEISNLAKSLIDLTTLKRRVTRDQESVGGEVDVAIISKSEGFVWVKRKHYFPAELNQRFFAKHYKEV